MRRAILLLCLCAIAAITSPAQTFTTLYHFQSYSGGIEPYGSLVQGVDGQFYGEAQDGGIHGGGTVFKLTSNGVLTNLYFFDPNNASEPNTPFGGLIQGKDGNFYGTSPFGGLSHQGAAFKVTPDGTLTTLHSFCTQFACNDGAGPKAGLVQGTDGSLYGTTMYAASQACNNGCGTVFKLTTDGLLTTLHMFQGTDGFDPEARLLLASDGNLYGTTAQGGNYFNNCGWGCGTIFRISPAGIFSTLYTFCTQGLCDDGGRPMAGIIQATDGNLYGTTTYDGINGCGTIFKVTFDGQLTTLHTFDRPHGCKPLGELVQGPDGSFYGTTFYGGAADYGTVFRLTPAGAFSVLHEFCTQKPCSDDSWPEGALTLGTDGLLYGATSDPGINGIGTVFTLDVGFVPLSISKTGGGTVIGGGGHINCGSVCSSVYVKGQQLELTAIPGPGSTFGGWTGCDNVQGSYCFVNMSAARNVTAAFSSSQVTLTSLVLKPSTVKGGQLSAATLTLSGPAPEGGLGVSIASNIPNAAHPPSWIVVPAGKSTASFAVRTFPVKKSTTVNISASTGGSQAGATLTVITGYGSQQVAGAIARSPGSGASN